VGANVVKMQFPDHYNFKQVDIDKITNEFNSIEQNNKIIICTEKDAVRFKTSKYANKLNKLPIYSLPIEVSLLDNKDAEFNKIIENTLTVEL
jgi:tetraacyldisaccharide 4'-kinase